jgi:hypothetical protein
LSGHSEPGKLAQLIAGQINVDNAKDNLSLLKLEYDHIRADDDAQFQCLKSALKETSTVCSSAAVSFSSPDVKTIFCQYRQICEILLAADENTKALEGGDLRNVDDSISSEEEAAAADQATAANLKTHYEQAKASYKQALEHPKLSCERILSAASVTGNPPASATRSSESAHSAGSDETCVQQTARLLQQGLHGLESSGLSGPALARREQLNRVNDILEATVKGASGTKSATDSSDKVALQVAASLPELENQIGNSFNYPKVAVLVLEAERLRLSLKKANDDMGRRESRIALLKAKRAAIISEIKLLMPAKRFVDLEDAEAKGYHCPRGRGGLVADFSKFPAYCREELVSGLLLYASAWDSGHAREEQIDYQLIALKYDESLDNSESALLQWQNLIGVPLGQLAAFYGSGIRPEDVARFLQAAGVGAVAAGVN